MLSSAHNVVPLLRSTADNRAILQGADAGHARDLASLKELSLQLQAARRLFANSADALNALSTSSVHMNIAVATDRFLGEIEALQAGTDALINAMTNHQPSA